MLNVHDPVAIFLSAVTFSRLGVLAARQLNAVVVAGFWRHSLLFLGPEEVSSGSLGYRAVPFEPQHHKIGRAHV